MKYQYTPTGVCSRMIDIDLSEDGVINSVKFTGGCNGNTKGICALVEGAKAEDVIGRLKGINCGSKGTSCPAQLAMALEQALEEL